MRTRPSRAVAPAVAALATTILLLAAAHPSSAQRVFTNRSLMGEYHVAIIEIHDEGAGVDYCDISGRVTFDGAGNAVFTGWRKCSVTGPTLEPGEAYTYSVNPDGSFTVTETATGDQTNGQITLSGHQLLLSSANTTSRALVRHGVATRR